MSLVFRGNFVKLYPDVDRIFTDSLIYQEKRYFLAKSNQQGIVDVSLFMLAMFMGTAVVVCVACAMIWMTK